METFPEYHCALRSSRSWRPAKSQDRHQIKLHHDVLDIVIQYVFLFHREDLFKLCRTSKQLYLACIPWIYRQITIDFSEPLTQALLRRLSEVSSKIPAYVRTIALENCSQATAIEWTLLDKALSRFTKLENLSWDNYANLPGFVLDSIHLHHPKSKVQTRVTQIYAGQATDRLVRKPNFFGSPVLKHLTSFDFSTKSNDFLYDNFKRDLVELLTNAPNLTYFRIYRGPIEDDGRKIFPEMLPQFRKARLPQLRALYLATRSFIFTRREIEIWALQDGWSKLQHLALSRATDLIPFISRVPQLTYLDINADNGEGMDELTEHLSSCTGKPLGAVKTLVYTHFMFASDLTSAMLVHTMPWSILDKTSTTLTKYISWHQPFEVFDPGFHTPTTHDLHRFRVNYPGVTDLTLDTHIRHNHWPREVLTKLAAFPNIERLSLYVHQPPQHNVNNVLRHVTHFGETKEADLESNCENAFKFIIGTQAKPYCEQKLQVEFKQIHDYKDMESHWTVADCMFWINKSGSISSSKRITEKETEPGPSPRIKYAKMSTDELRARRLSMKSSKEFGHRCRGSYKTTPMEDDWAEIIVEITRRERHAILERLYGDESVTLYDRWTSEDNLHGGNVAV
ncbi:Nn.00g109090.m01.CDS01 [Neocucurbitaria sp. VM-36]